MIGLNYFQAWYPKDPPEVLLLLSWLPLKRCELVVAGRFADIAREKLEGF